MFFNKEFMTILSYITSLDHPGVEVGERDLTLLIYRCFVVISYDGELPYLSVALYGFQASHMRAYFILKMPCEVGTCLFSPVGRESAI